MSSVATPWPERRPVLKVLVVRAPVAVMRPAVGVGWHDIQRAKAVVVGKPQWGPASEAGGQMPVLDVLPQAYWVPQWGPASEAR